jgi:uncharacterized protein
VAGASLLVLLDDIASVLDDVATMTKVAAKKTSGVLGDDLALNAQQVAGVNADRELPVVWAVAKGSALNKAILVPAALAISTFVPWAIAWLLIAGGLFLCFEGVEKLVHKALHKSDQVTPKPAAPGPHQTSAQIERNKVKGAVRTDFILSAEIIVITLGVLAGKPLVTQITVLSTVAALMTVGVYGLVAAIVKLDDLGLWLIQRSHAIVKALGRAILWFAPWLMKLLSVAGTVAMFLVGGGIVVHNIEALHHLVEQLGFSHPWWLAMLADLVLGIVAGALVLLVWLGIKKVQGLKSVQTHG